MSEVDPIWESEYCPWYNKCESGKRYKALEQRIKELREAAEKANKTYYTSGVNTMYGLNELRKAMENLKQVLKG